MGHERDDAADDMDDKKSDCGVRGRWGVEIAVCTASASEPWGERRVNHLGVDHRVAENSGTSCVDK